MRIWVLLLIGSDLLYDSLYNKGQKLTWVYYIADQTPHHKSTDCCVFIYSILANNSLEDMTNDSFIDMKQLRTL